MMDWAETRLRLQLWLHQSWPFRALSRWFERTVPRAQGFGNFRADCFDLRGIRPGEAMTEAEMVTRYRNGRVQSDKTRLFTECHQPTNQEIPMTTQNNTFIEIDTSVCQKVVADMRDLTKHNQAAEIRVVLTEQGQLKIWANRRDAAIAARQWHGVDQAFTLKAQSAQFLEWFLTSDEVQTLLRKVHSGHEVEWNGHNYVGVLDEEGRDACERLHRLFDEYGIEDYAYFLENEYVNDSNSEE